MRLSQGLFLLLLIFTNTAKSQLTGIKNIPGDYADLATAITALNSQGVGAGGVTINLLAGNLQNAPAGGYIIGGAGSAILSTTSSSNQVIIEGNSNILNAFSPQPAGATNDGVFKLIGADWITIQHFNIQENTSNTITTVTSNNMTEWGIALLYATTTDGSKFNSILNNTISLNGNYSNSTAVYSNVRHNASVTNLIADISNISGANTDNKVYGNNISNIAAAIIFNGSATIGNMDINNEIGGSSAATGNTISNWKGRSPVSFADIGASGCIYYGNAKSFRITYNTISNSTTANGPSNLRAIQIMYSNTNGPAGVYDILNNNISFAHTGSANVTPIEVYGVNGLSTQQAINISNNTLSNISMSSPGAGSFRGISVSMPTVAVNINNNSIVGISSATTSGSFSGISNTSGSGSSTVNISQNQFGSATSGAFTFTSATTGSVNIIQNLGSTSSSSVRINENILQGFSFVSTGNFTGISNSSTPTVTLEFNNNKFGTADREFVSWSSSISNAFDVLYNSVSVNSTNVNMNGNDFTKINFPLGSSSNINFIVNTPTLTKSQSFSDNSFTNLVMNTTGNVIFIYSASTLTVPGVSAVDNNSIVNGFSKTGAGGIVGFIWVLGTSTSNNLSQCKFNNFSNVTVTGFTQIFGIKNHDGGPGFMSNHVTKYISYNTIQNIHGDMGEITLLDIKRGSSLSSPGVTNNTISNITANADITGIIWDQPLFFGSVPTTIKDNELHDFQTSTNVVGIKSSNVQSGNIVRNTIYSFSSTGPGEVCAVKITDGTSNNVRENKIYDLTNTNTFGYVIGISNSGGNSVSIYNNLVGNLYAPSANTDISIAGISITGGISADISFNTVLLNASSTGAGFGTSAIYALTAPSVTLRNNILINKSTATSGHSVVYRRSDATLSTYGSASNNNLFYIENPGPTNLVYYDGSSGDQTLASFQTRVAPRDAASIGIHPNFLSTTGSNPGFLHINYTIPTPIDGGAAPISGITTDFDLQIRNSVTPDIGADEFNIISCPVSIQVNPTSATVCGNSSVTLTATPGFNYLWNTGAVTQTIIVTSSGNYSVSGSIPGCASVNSNIVPVNFSSAPPVPVITASGPTSFCTGGSITLTAPAGYIYQWSTSATTQTINVTTSGSYTVTIRNASGCSSTSVATVVTVNPAPPIPVITASGSTTICAGGSVTLSAPAGFAYVWNTGSTSQSINVNISGNYSVIVTNANGCSATSATTTVTVNALPPVPVITPNGPVNFCQGGSVTLTAPAGYTYLWSTGATTQSILVNSSGSYNVRITNANNCSAISVNTIVTVNPSPPTPLITQVGNTLFSSSPASNQWYLNGTIIPGATGSSYTFTTGGTYSVVVTNTSGCSSAGSGFSVIRSEVVQLGNNEKFYFKIYPNPFSTQLRIDYQLEQSHKIEIRLVDILGQTIAIQRGLQQTPGRYSIPLDNIAERLQRATYLVEFIIDGYRISRFVIKL